MNSIIFDNEIVLYWELPEGYESGDVYSMYINEKKEKESSKTHFSIDNLQPSTDYSIRVEWKNKNGTLKAVLSDEIYQTNPEKKRLNVKSSIYNAAGDGKTLDTKAIQRAINDCKAGECVYIPEGVYLCGKLDLHSDMELYLEKGAVIKGTANVEDYLPKRASRFEGYEMMCYSSLINMGEMDHKQGYNCKNVTIRGGGTISGGGNELRENILKVEHEFLKDYIESLGEEINTFENFDTIPGRTRPRLVNISNSQNIVLSGITMEYGPAWNVHMIYSDNIVTHGCTIRSRGVSNGDGWDPDSSTNCTLFDIDFDTHDDIVAIKSGKNPEGDKIARPSDNIKVFDCRGKGQGCAIGSEMSGGVSNVHIWDCDLSNSIGGIVIKATPERGGYVKNIKVENTVLSTIKVLSSVSYNNDGKASPDVPVFENFEFNNLKILGLTWNRNTKKFEERPAIYLSGFDEEGHKLRNVSLKNIHLPRHSDGSPQSIKFIACKGINIENLVCD